MATMAMLAACVSNSGEARKDKQSSDKDAASYNLQLGVGYLRRGDLQLAKDKLEKAVEQDPDLADAHMALAFLYEQIQQEADAERHFKRATRLEPNNPDVQNTYGAFLCKQGKTREAVAAFEKAAGIPLYRTPEAAYTNAGVCVLNDGQLDAADRYFREALGKNPRYGEALLQLASLSLQREQYLPARAFLQRYLDGNKPNAEVLWLGVRIERAMGDAEAAKRYSSQLKKNFPESDETRQLLESEQDAG
jgi:type IV pilus assembly protein PilF